jgi:hypothetical protein
MNAIRISRRLDSQVIDWPELAPLIGKRVQIIVLEEEPQEEPTPAGPQGGTAKGEIWMAPDFNDTPEEFKDYM